MTSNFTIHIQLVIEFESFSWIQAIYFKEKNKNKKYGINCKTNVLLEYQT